jgi:HPt (histidine-containing phosphotransfer) domain-containing protein
MPDEMAGSTSIASDAETLESDVGPEVYQELLASFRAHLLVQVVELRSAAATGDVAAAQYVAHQMKGTAPSFGALRLDDLAHRLLGIQPHDVALLDDLVSEIDAEVDALQSVVTV